MDKTRAVPVPINRIEALDPATGQVKWANFTAPPPPSGLPAADTAALNGVTPGPGMAIFAQGPRMYGLSAEDGRQLWGVLVTAGTGAGLNPNISSITVVDAAPDLPNGRQHPLLLLQSSTWDQTRFMAYVLNGTAINATAPPVEAWKVRCAGRAAAAGQLGRAGWALGGAQTHGRAVHRLAACTHLTMRAAPRCAPAPQMQGNNNFEGTLNDDLSRLGLGMPVASPTKGVFLFWSNRTCERGARARGGCTWLRCTAHNARLPCLPLNQPPATLRPPTPAAYDINNGGQPMYTTHLVGRSLKDGGAVWASSMAAAGFSQLPVSPPLEHVGVAAAVTGSQMLVLNAGGGGVRYTVDQGE